MAKSRRKKNYKLRRRVMRTVAALTMIMAVVVAAIPVENYGTMQAAGAAWNEANAYPTNFDLLKVNRLNDNDLKGYTNERVVQEVSGGYLSTIVKVQAKNADSGAPAILDGFPSTTSSTALDVRENMYYQYVSYPESDIDNWVSALQGKNESYELKYNISNGVSRSWNGNSVTLPQKFDTTNSGIVFNRATNSYYDGTKNNLIDRTRDTDFTAAEIFTNSDAYFAGVYSSYKSVVDEYNREVEELESVQFPETFTQADWDDFVGRVENQKKKFTDNNYTLMKAEVVVNADLGFTDHSAFYLDSFCNRVECAEPKISLKGFTLENCYEIRDTETANIYVVKWKKQDRSDLGERGKYVDQNGYLANGSVKIVGVADEAFRETQISKITLPNSIIAIGDSAFEGSRLSELNFNPRSCTKIGDKAFYGCNNLTGINLTNSNAEGDDQGQTKVAEIGAEAFYGTGITEIELPDTLTKIYGGCFADSSLNKVVFSAASGSVEIGEYAFYNCDLGDEESSGVTFPSSKVTIKKAAFSVAYNSKNSMGTFSFPENMELEEYILAGRTNLSSVIFPNIVSGTIPEHTFRNCEGLERVVLGEISHHGNNGSNVSYGVTGSAPSTIFEDVENFSFHVEGPGFTSNGDDAQSKENTLELEAGKNTTNSFFVPYVFLDEDNTTRKIEQKQKSDDGLGDFIAEVEATDSGATLTDYKNSSLTETSRVKIVVPSNVAGYNVTALGENCFKNVINNMIELEIQDYTISVIGEGALKNAPHLEKVIVGNSVESIGSDAFLDCPELTEVHFNEPLGTEMDIASTAFRTNSDSLTFHGVVDANYAPFAYAMGKLHSDTNTAGFTNKKAGKNICYESLVEIPDSLQDDDSIEALEKNAVIRIIRDNETGASTLIDYPHLEIMGDYVLDALSAYMGNSTENPLTEDQARIINTAMNIVIPEGIESIDAKTYFSRDRNAENKDYIDGKLNSGQDKLIDLYSNSHKDGVTDGLFSGYFYENAVGGLITKIASLSDEDTIVSRDAQINLKQSEYTEIEPRGNDHLTSIVLGSTVSGMPEEYAFDSCENLTSVSLGGNVKDIGHLPFRGCTSLVNVVGNGYYQCENRILYGKSDPDSAEGRFDKLVECLETRDRTVNRFVSVETDPRLAEITSIDEEAFLDCKYIWEVDFTGTQITGIPKDCFKGDEGLYKITLPDSVRFVQEGAFVTGNSDRAVEIYVYNPNCNIDSLAIDPKTSYVIYSNQYIDEDKTQESAVYNFCDTYKNNSAYDVTFKEIPKNYVIEFRDNDNELIEAKDVPLETKEVTPPDMDEFLSKNPDKHKDEVFDTWRWIDESNNITYEGKEAYSNVNENRKVFARYTRADYTFTGEEVTVNIVGGTVNGNGTINTEKTSIKIPSGNDIFITADSPTDQTFRNWSVSDGLDQWLNDIFSTQTTFKVPNPPESGTITITANFINTPGGGTDTPNPDGTYTVTVNNGTGGGNYRPGATVTITANAAPTGQTFANWTAATAGVSFANANTATTTFVMPSAHVTVTANYSGGSGTNTPNPDGTYTVTVNNGTGGGNYQPGATVTITANAAPTGQSFTNWTTSTTGVSFANANSNSTTFVMPSSNVTVTANFSGGSSTGKYKVTVNYGSGSGEYSAGETVNITANAPESSSRVFSRWTTNNSGLGFANANSVSTSFVMPAADVTVTANYRTRTDEDDDDDDSPSRRPGTNTTTNTVNNRPSSSTSTTGTNGTVNNPANGTTNNNGNRIYITKNGISNTDVASLAVSGSTDNFIVRITESPEATAAVEQALTNTYGSLNGLAYLPMDISLYDSTGQNKITDTTGLNITVTMPIPDVLIQYGGNARVAAADNGNLQQITPRFTTIDGIACISFVPPHFSPYVIYVDTNNLIAGQMLDSTPATGDPIHPKWFAAIGMACVSVLLFVLSDGRKRRKYRAA